MNENIRRLKWIETNRSESLGSESLSRTLGNSSVSPESIQLGTYISHVYILSHNMKINIFSITLFNFISNEHTSTDL